jgi:23S rRNA (uracil1939-C5)-methyltransferase
MHPLGDSEHVKVTYEADLDRMAFGGDAFGRLPDGRALFVPYALPGERVSVQLKEEKRGYARGELLDVITPSALRIEPRCPHFTTCGGCHYQHIPYPTQLEVKREVLVDQLKRIGKLEEPAVEVTVASPEAWNYRNHLQFHINPEGKMGFYAPRSHDVVPIRECHLPLEGLNDLWRLLKIEPIPGLHRLSFRQGTGDQVMVVIESEDPEPPDFSIDVPVSAVHLGPDGLSVLADNSYLYKDVGDFRFRVSATSFFQVNTSVAEAMVDYLMLNLPLEPTTSIMDVYCGVGLFSAYLAPQVAQVIGIEVSPGACDDFMVNLEEYDNVTLYEASAEEALLEVDVQPDIILVDPPRSGLARKALDAILELSPKVLAYVSCDPATLGRDALRLKRGGFGMVKAVPFDMFPQTCHIESISLWERE